MVVKSIQKENSKRIPREGNTEDTILHKGDIFKLGRVKLYVKDLRMEGVTIENGQCNECYQDNNSDIQPTKLLPM